MGRRTVKITADTDILLRTVLDDEPEQAAQARAVLQRAELIAVPVAVFCELVWTMRRLYRRTSDEVATAVEAILQTAAVVTDRPAVEAGLRVLRAGGDFADGTIAWQGAAMGAATMATFDRHCVHLLNASRLAAAHPAELLSRG
jgi:predicted nucleic-acid-binding protein